MCLNFWDPFFLYFYTYMYVLAQAFYTGVTPRRALGTLHN